MTVPVRDPADAELVGRLQRGEPAAFETMVRRLGGPLLSVARRLLRNEEDARDAVQDAFLSAYRSLADFEGGSELATWLHRIVVNASLMKLRTRRRKPEEPIEPLLPQFLENGHHAIRPSDWPSSGEALLALRENREFVRACIDDLPESYRVVLMLRDIEELDTAETALALDVSESLVKVRLHRARQALRTLLEPRFKEGG